LVLLLVLPLPLPLPLLASPWLAAAIAWKDGAPQQSRSMVRGLAPPIGPAADQPCPLLRLKQGTVVGIDAGVWLLVSRWTWACVTPKDHP